MGGLSFMHPAGLWLLAAWLPVVGQYVLKTRRQRVRVPSTWLWQAARQDQQARSPWRRLVPEVTLALELLGVAALALAAAGPGWHAVSHGLRVALIVDTSASMTAQEGTTTRMDLARAALHRRVAGLGPDDAAMVITAGRAARVVAPLGTDRAGLHRAIDRVAATEAEGGLDGALALAADRLRGVDGRHRAVVVTDGAVAVQGATGRVDLPVEALRVGTAMDNAGIVRMDVRAVRDATGAGRVRVVALVANAAGATNAPAERVLTVRMLGTEAPVATVSVRARAGERVPVAADFPVAAADTGRGLVVTLTPHDGLAVDDTAYAQVPPARAMSVVLAATAEDPWLRRALTADQDVTLSAGSPEAGMLAPPGALVVYDGSCPARLPARDVLVLAPPAGTCAGVTVDPAVTAPGITSYATQDARFRFLTLDGVHLAEAWPLTPGAAHTTLMRAGDHALMVDAGDADRAVTVVGVDPAASDWPLRASFVVFIRNVVELAREHRDRAAAGGGMPGEPLRVAVPTDATGLAVTGPAGRVSAARSAGMVVVGETSETGHYRVTWPGGQTLASVNLFSERESNLLDTGWQPPATMASPAGGLAVQGRREAGPWCSLLAALAMAANLGWLTRRPASRRTA